ncbi:MAG: DUF4105 domain-containing protein [Treponema sp.]|nr:DUF4105 domain-containing protein [Treponema sp.]
MRPPSIPKIPLFLLFLLFLGALSTPLGAQDQFTGRGDDLVLRLAVIGPGNELYFWWGHIGLVVEDMRTGEELFFDWGVFSFDNENFFTNFTMGRLIYSCYVSPADWNYRGYINTNRDITLYTLDLDPERKEEVLRRAAINMLPENRDYNYHHFDDNCATRIRDLLDIALEGRFFEAYGQMPSQFTLRQQVRRHTWFNPLVDWALSFWMGQRIDRPITVWDDMFLPSEIGRRALEFSYTDNSGRQRPLVSSVEVIYASQGRPVVREIPRPQGPQQLIGSLVFSALLLGFYKYRGGTLAFRRTLGLTQASLGLFFGIAGTMLAFMMALTDHDYTYENANILFVNPLFIASIPLGLRLAFNRDEDKRQGALKISLVFWIYLAAAGLISMLIRLFPPFYQQNQDSQAMIIPAALALALVYYWLTRGREPPEP